MANAITRLLISKDRQNAKSTAEAALIPVGNHISDDIDASVVILTPPAVDDAQYLKLQALGQNIRYRIDGEAPTIVDGFQLAAGSDVLIPVNVDQIQIIAELDGGTYEAQWCR